MNRPPKAVPGPRTSRALVGVVGRHLSVIPSSRPPPSISLWVAVLHQRLPTSTTGALGDEAPASGRSGDPGLRDLDPVLGDERREPAEGGAVDPAS